jgi:hypothetical protein
MEIAIAARENEGGARQSRERKAQKFAGHGTLLVGVLYAFTIIVVILIVSRL